jgi:hypothetical protein
MSEDKEKDYATELQKLANRGLIRQKESDNVIVDTGPEPGPIERTKIYLVGSLRNGRVPEIANELRAAGYAVFDDWFAAGPEADDWWKKYEQARGRTYKEALKGKAAQNVFRFDKENIDASSVVVLVAPAGRSGHAELGYAAGRGKRTYVLRDLIPDEERWDVMYAFFDGVFDTVEELCEELAAA